MPKLRGKYKRYLYDESIKIPETTLRRLNKNTIQSNETVHTIKNLDSTATIDSPIMNVQSSMNNNDSLDEAIINTIDLPIDNAQAEVILKINISYFYANKYLFFLSKLINDNLNTNDDKDTDENSFNELADLIENKDISREELAAAYLAAFFSGKLTQTALSTFLKLSNLTSKTKLLESFYTNIRISFKFHSFYQCLGYICIFL